MTITTRLYIIQSSGGFMAYAMLRLAAPEGQHAEAIQSFLSTHLRTCAPITTAEDVTDRNPLFVTHHPMPDVVWLSPTVPISIHAPWVHSMIALFHFVQILHALGPCICVDLDLNLMNETGTATVMHATNEGTARYLISSKYLPDLPDGDHVIKPFDPPIWSLHHRYIASYTPSASATIKGEIRHVETHPDVISTHLQHLHHLSNIRSLLLEKIQQQPKPHEGTKT